MSNMVPAEIHRLSSVSFAGKRRCTCGKRVEQDENGKWIHLKNREQR